MSTGSSRPNVAGLLAAPAPAVLTTYRSSGSAVTSPVWFREHDGFLEVVLAVGDVKLRHLAADPRAGLTVFEATAPFRGVRIECHPRQVADDVTEARTAIARRYLGEVGGARFAAGRAPAGVILRFPLAGAKVWDLSAILPALDSGTLASPAAGRENVAMEPRISLITLGVADLERSLRFYRDGLGLPTTRRAEDGIVFFQTSGVTLALFPYDELAADVGDGWNAPRSKFPGITLAHNVRERDQVDDLIALAERAGATVVKPAADTEWGGYSGYFTDPDGYLWEVAWGAFDFNEDGSLAVT